MAHVKMKPDSTSRRILYKPDEDKLYNAFNKMVTVTEEDTQEKALQKQQRAERFSEFQKLNARQKASQRGRVEPKRLSYDMIPQYLSATGFSYRDLLEITNGEDGERAQLFWTTEIEKNMCSACDSLSPAIRERIYGMILEILPATMRDLLFSEDTQDNRVFDLAESREVKPGETYRKIKDQSILRDVCTFRKTPNRAFEVIPFGKYNAIVSLLDVSYHWVLGLNETTCVLAKNGDTEMIMDAFCLLPDRWKEILLASAQRCLNIT